MIKINIDMLINEIACGIYECGPDMCLLFIRKALKNNMSIKNKTYTVKDIKKLFEICYNKEYAEEKAMECLPLGSIDEDIIIFED